MSIASTSNNIGYGGAYVKHVLKSFFGLYIYLAAYNNGL